MSQEVDMKATIRYCDVCAGDGELRIATSEYNTPEGHWFDACNVHCKAAETFGFPVQGLADQVSLALKEGGYDS